jgi:hypothetical protein
MATTSDSSSQNVSERLRTGLALVQSQLSVERARSRWSGFPESLRAALQRAASRVRDRLDIPSKAELSELVQRIEAIDRKLDEAQASRASDIANLERKLTKPAAKRTRKKSPTDAPRPRRAKSKAKAEANAKSKEPRPKRSKSKSSRRRPPKAE